jgi:glutamyl-tRNA synthetase
MSKVRTRIAPSPTGFVHIGTIHNAIFAHALAKSQGGDFILRIEDTDQKRFIEGASEELYTMLDAFGLTPDEGPIQGGPHAPYIQSERLKNGNRYGEIALQLIESGAAYYCFLTSAELEEMKGGLVDKQKRERAFRSPYRDLPLSEAKERVAKGEEHVVRLKVPNDEFLDVDDAILGNIRWSTNEVDDQVLIKSDGFPTYQLAVVVDDHDMEITHITRAYEWLTSTPKQILLYRALGWELPVFAHSSLILDPAGGKLSKRKGNVSAREFLMEGYLPAAIINFLILLGWSAPIERVHGEKEREIFSHAEFIQMYRLEDRQKHNAIFDRDKLVWFNQKYLSSMPVADLVHEFRAWLDMYGVEAGVAVELKDALLADSMLDAKLGLVATRARLLKEIPEMLRFFYFAPIAPQWDHEKLKHISAPTREVVLKGIRDLFASLPDNSATWTHEAWEQGMRAIGDAHSIKHGDVFMILRIAVVGEPFSPPLFECLQIMGKEVVLERL